MKNRKESELKNILQHITRNDSQKELDELRAYDNIEFSNTTPPQNKKPAKYHLRIANSRGKMPVMVEIEAARGLIVGALAETADCEGKEALKKCDTLLWAILTDNE